MYIQVNQMCIFKSTHTLTRSSLKLSTGAARRRGDAGVGHVVAGLHSLHAAARAAPLPRRERAAGPCSKLALACLSYGCTSARGGYAVVAAFAPPCPHDPTTHPKT